MDRIKGALIAMKADPARAVEILRMELEADREGFLAGLGAFLVEVLDGVVPDPEKL